MRKYIFRNISAKQWLLIIVLLFYISGYNVGVSLILQLSVDFALRSKKYQLIYTLLILLIGTLIYGWTFYNYNIILEKIKQNIANNISENLISNHLSSYEHEKSNNNSGEMINLVQIDTQIVSDYLIKGLLPLLSMLLTIFIALIYIMNQSLIFSLLYIVSGVVLFLISFFFQKREAKYREEYMKALDNHRSFYVEAHQNQLILSVFTDGTWTKDRHNNLYYKEMKYYNNVMKINSLNNATISEGVYIITALSLIVGLFLVYNNIINLPILIGVWNAAIGSIFFPIIDLPQITSYLSEHSSSTNRLLKQQSFSRTKKSAATTNINSGEYLIKGENISFSYGENSILENFSFTLLPNKLSYIIGNNGSGKSTLIKLILGELIPDSGFLYLVDKEKDLRYAIQDGNFGYVPSQASLIPNTTIRENLTYGREVNDSIILDLLDLVNLSNFSNKLDEIVVNETEMSYGQVKRLAIVRSLLHEPDYIFLDEPFSDLDVYNQKKLMDILKEISQKCGIIIVTHNYDYFESENHILKIGE